jgi:8-oxo-dGTP diphosphatase
MLPAPAQGPSDDTARSGNGIDGDSDSGAGASGETRAGGGTEPDGAGTGLTDQAAAARFPRLFSLQRWEWGGIDALFSLRPPDEALVTNVHVVGYCDGGVVICRTEYGHWFLPGGTRERGESVLECARRELMEEAGARIVGPLHTLGAHHCVTDLPEPYRPWQPHPEKAWLWCSADLEIVGEPLNPADGEQVAEVRIVEPEHAAALLLRPEDEAGGSDTWNWLPELLLLSDLLRGSR